MVGLNVDKGIISIGHAQHAQAHTLKPPEVLKGF